MKKKVLTIVLTAVLFLSAVALGVSTIFRVDSVALKATVTTETGNGQIRQLQEDLEALYNEQSIFSAKKEQAEELLVNYPYLRVTGFEKSYPNKLTLTVVEDTEVYAVEAKSGGYYILGGNGIVITHRETADLSGGENVLIKDVQATGKRGYALTGDSCWNSLLTLCRRMDESLGGIQKNVLSVSIRYRTPETVYEISMREGVKIYVNDPATLTEEKATVAIEKYLSLNDQERTAGRILVIDAAGKVDASYASKNEFGN